MNIFIAGATGVIGRSLVPQLLERGHSVTAMTRDEKRADRIARQGAEPVVCDVYDAARLDRVVGDAAPDVVVHQLTSLPAAIHPRHIAEHLAANDRIRTEGTRNLLRAARRAGVRRVVAQSIAFAYTPHGSLVKDETAPLWLDAPWPWQRTVRAVEDLEAQVTSNRDIEGVVLRYGYFYGPGTAYAADGSVAALVRRRQFPLVGAGSGVFSFVHVSDAAAATVLALDNSAAGIYNIVDDEPSPMRDWLPVYADALGARGPRRVPRLLARFAAGRYGLYMMTDQRGASNARAKKELGWSPCPASWRTGFRDALAGEAGRSVQAHGAEATTGV